MCYKGAILVLEVVTCLHLFSFSYEQYCVLHHQGSVLAVVSVA